MSEYVLKTQIIPFLFLVFHFEAKDTPSPIDQLPLSIHFDSKRELINATIFFRWALQVVKTQLIPRLYPPSKNTIYTPAIPPPHVKIGPHSLIKGYLPYSLFLFHFLDILNHLFTAKIKSCEIFI